MCETSEKCKQKWYVYILETCGGRLYTGITTDLKRRFDEHCGKSSKTKGAKFTRAFTPKKIIASWETVSRSEASKIEAHIKTLSRERKNKLVKNFKKIKSDNYDLFLSELEKIVH